jgi:hypothetical protein
MGKFSKTYFEFLNELIIEENNLDRLRPKILPLAKDEFITRIKRD